MTRNIRLEELIDLSRRCDEVKQMIRIVCDAEGVTSAGHLCDVSPETFTELYDAAKAIEDQLGVE